MEVISLLKDIKALLFLILAVLGFLTGCAMRDRR